MNFRRVWSGAAVLAAGSMLAVASPAYAGPPVAPTPPIVQPRNQGPGDPGTTTAPTKDPRGGKRYTWNLTKGKWAAVKRATKAFSPAHVNRQGQVDARWIKKVIPNRYQHGNDRYALEAGAWYRTRSWVQLKHITRAEKKAVIRWAKTHSGPNPRRVVAGNVRGDIVAATLALSVEPGAATVMKRLAPKPCTGRTVTAVNEPDKLYWVYLNSCDTANLLDVMEGGYQVIGVLGVILGFITEGLAAIPAAVYAGVLWAARKYIENRKNASTLDAVIMRFSWNVKKSRYGRYYAPWRVFPQ